MRGKIRHNIHTHMLDPHRAHIHSGNMPFTCTHTTCSMVRVAMPHAHHISDTWLQMLDTRTRYIHLDEWRTHLAMSLYHPYSSHATQAGNISIASTQPCSQRIWHMYDGCTAHAHMRGTSKNSVAWNTTLSRTWGASSICIDSHFSRLSRSLI